MPTPDLENLWAEIASLTAVRDVGRVCGIGRGAIMISGLSHVAGIGDQVGIALDGGAQLGGEVIALDGDVATVFPDGPTEGATLGARAIYFGPTIIAPDNGWIGRIIDPSGAPLDGRPILRGRNARSLTGAPPPATRRRQMAGRLETGIAVFNTLLPLVRGQRIGLFSGSGVGKSSLLAKFAKGVDADVVVIALVGERGREVREFVENTLGKDGLARAVVVAATSDRSALIRRRCAMTAMSVAEHFRDQGSHVLLLTDSVTRFAEAHREIALASGEDASLQGHPPSMAQAIMSLAERAGPGLDHTGDITAIFSVLVAGSDMEEPVADTLRGVLDGHVVLDRTIAERGRYPAIDLLRSVSRSLPRAASDAENVLINHARRLLGAYDRAEMMVQAGLYSPGSDPDIDAALPIWPALDRFLAEDEKGDAADSFARLARLLQGASGADAAAGPSGQNETQAKGVSSPGLV